jgi:hypothetical protein
MMRKHFDENRAISNATEHDDTHLYCRAHGCPKRWSFAATGETRGVCSAHMRAQETKDWPAITADVRAGLWPDRHYTGEDFKLMMVARQKADEEMKSKRLGNDKLTGAWVLRNSELNACGMLPTGRPMTGPQRDFWRAALRNVIQIDEVTQ